MGVLPLWVITGGRPEDTLLGGGVGTLEFDPSPMQTAGRRMKRSRGLGLGSDRFNRFLDRGFAESFLEECFFFLKKWVGNEAMKTGGLVGYLIFAIFSSIQQDPTGWFSTSIVGLSLSKAFGWTKKRREGTFPPF